MSIATRRSQDRKNESSFPTRRRSRRALSLHGLGRSRRPGSPGRREPMRNATQRGRERGAVGVVVRYGYLPAADELAEQLELFGQLLVGPIREKNVRHRHTPTLRPVSSQAVITISRLPYLKG